MASEQRLARYVVLCLVAVISFGAMGHFWFPDSPGGRPAEAALPGPAGGHLSLLGSHGSAETYGPPAAEHDCGSLTAAEALSGGQILSYYGNPLSADMGIIGELSPDQLMVRLEAHSELYDQLNGPQGVQPALHIVEAVAQTAPGVDGRYLQHLDEETLKEYIDLACERGMLVFLDLQIGRSDVRTEVQRVLPYLSLANVHLALDPEFAMAEGEEPGQTIGSLTGQEINIAQALLQGVSRRTGQEKVLVVHQFLESMITRPEVISDYPGVRLVIDMDGFGPAEVKQVKYGWYKPRARYSGIKLFFRYDPDLMSEQQVLALQPNVIIYQ